MSQGSPAAPAVPVGGPVVVAVSLAGTALLGNIAMQMWLRRRRGIPAG